MRYFLLFGSLMVSLDLFGASIATAMPANGSAIVKADSSKNVIEVFGGCGSKYKPNKKTGQCEPY
jgi:hypothetical protein